MLTLNQDVTYYRRLIYTSFKGLLNETQTLKAVNLWENYFADSSVFSPVRFLRVCRETLVIPHGLAKILVQRLSENMAMPIEELEPDPFTASDNTQIAPIRNKPDMPRPSPSYTPEPPPKRSEQVVFEFVLSTLLNGVWHDRREFLSYAEGNVGKRATRMVQLWANASSPQLSVPELEQREMSRVLDAVYAWYCDMFGPNATDQSFARALAQAEKLPDAALFSPRKFL